MGLEQALREFVDHVAVSAPALLLVMFRVAGIFVMAPLLGSARIPKRVRVMLVVLIGFSMAGAVRMPVALPADLATLTIALGGELFFGIAMGMCLSFVFVAAQWAGEIMGQQMGLSLAQSFDPQFGASSSLIGDLQYLLALLIFMSPLVNGPAALFRGVHASFAVLPPLSVGLDASVFALVIQMFTAATMLSLQIAAPMLVTMLIVDVAMGALSKTMPQMNVMTMGLTVRSLVGMIVLVAGVKITSEVLVGAVSTNVDAVEAAYSLPPVR
ncbi:MAG TPA: flagellar biosynthetic protein FliR [Tepidisphaeraceae bacterium]|nr:flagellar biosynthetic protein FliR [Tepidisphaeraceae bacterium]